MANPLQAIIQNLLASDDQLIKKGTHDLNEAYKHPETIPALFELMVKAEEAPIRQYSAVLLSKRLGKLRNWQMVSPDIQQVIKSNILNKILEEKESSVRTAICQLFGTIIRHESDKADGWMDSILRFIFEYCSSPDSNVSEMGSNVFAKLANAAPDQFVSHIDAICQMFTAAMTATEASGNMGTPVIQNIVAGMQSLVPFILGHNAAEQTYRNSIPYIIKALFAMSKQPDVEKFRSTFELLEVMLDYTPKLLSASVKALLEFCIVLGKDASLDPVVRVQAVAFIGALARQKKLIIIKQNLLEPTLGVIFELIASPSTDDEDEDYFLDSDDSGPKTTAAQTLDIIALNMPPEKLIPPLLAILEPALQNNDPMKRKAAYICIAIISEGCSEAICDQYLPPMIDIIQKGIADPDVQVRNAAFYALGQFSEHMKPEICEYANHILPMLLQHLHQLCADVKGRGEDYNMKPIERVFYALYAYLEELDEKVLTPYLPQLMEIIFKALDAGNPPNIRESAMQVISSTCNSVKTGLLPYFQTIITFLQGYLVKSEQEDIVNLQPEAIDTLSALARCIGPENFMPLASQTIQFGLMMLAADQGKEDPSLRRSLYNLFSSLSIVIKNEMAPVFEKIMEPIFDSVLSTDDVLAEPKDDNLDASAGGDAEIDISHSDDEGDDDDDDNIAGYSVDEMFLDEKEAAIIALMEFAENSPEAFLPYLETAFQNIYKCIDHLHESVRKVCITTLGVFSMLLYKQNDKAGVETAIKILLPKLCKMVHDDEECVVVIEALDCIGVILSGMKQTALQTPEFRESIYNCIKDVLEFKIVCQFNLENEDDDSEVEESEYEGAVFDSAANLLPSFGGAMEPEQFALYFERITPLLLKMLDKKSANTDNNRRSLIYGVLAECFMPLGTHCKIYFDILCPLLINGFSGAKRSATLQNSIYALGELVLHSEEKSFSQYPTILQALSNAVSGEENPSVLDNICGAIARLIITNYTLVPLEQVLPVFFQHLPLREDKEESLMILKCLNVLYVHALNVVQPMLDKFVTVAVASITEDDDKNEDKDNKEKNEMIELGLNLLNTIQNNYPNEFVSVMNSIPPEQNQKLQILIQNRANQ